MTTKDVLIMKKEFSFLNTAPVLYDTKTGYGFVAETTAHPVRTLYPEKLTASSTGIVMPPCPEYAYHKNNNAFDNIGLAFRMDLPEPGVYHIAVTVSSDPKTTRVAVAGMHADQVASIGYWDAARLIPRVHMAGYTDNVWHYDYVCPASFLEIEVEPTAPDLEVGIQSITLEKISPVTEANDDLPTIFTIGDSTVKSYIYEENLMSSWGQIFDDFFNPANVHVINYSMGGRSLSSIYREGRMNDLLLCAKPGDYILLQSGHNDEARGEVDGPEARFGRGNYDHNFINWLDTYFVPAAKMLGLNLILVSPMTRVHGDKTEGDNIIFCGFAPSNSIDCPRLLKEAAARHNLPFIDLYGLGIEYLKSIGGDATKAIYLSVEAGETCGKTNSGSYANGHPDSKCDGTHYKEALSKQFARIVASELYRQNLIPVDFFAPYAQEALCTGDAYLLLPEMSVDVQTGRNSYYRNQIEFLIKHGIMTHDEEKKFYPLSEITIGEFTGGLCKALKLAHFPAWEELTDYGKLLSPDLEDKEALAPTLSLTREKMAWLVYRAYLAAFPIESAAPNGEESLNAIPPYVKPAYMTNYNGCNISFDDPNYDPNLTGESAMYYPLVPWEKITDKADISAPFYHAVQECYRLGLMRSENGIARGRMINGSVFEPGVIVTKEKAAKELYFLQGLTHSIYDETDKY